APQPRPQFLPDLRRIGGVVTDPLVHRDDEGRKASSYFGLDVRWNIAIVPERALIGVGEDLLELGDLCVDGGPSVLRRRVGQVAAVGQRAERGVGLAKPP